MNNEDLEKYLTYLELPVDYHIRAAEAFPGIRAIDKHGVELRIDKPTQRIKIKINNTEYQAENVQMNIKVKTIKTPGDIQVQRVLPKIGDLWAWGCKDDNNPWFYLIVSGLDGDFLEVFFRNAITLQEFDEWFQRKATTREIAGFLKLAKGKLYDNKQFQTALRILTKKHLER